MAATSIQVTRHERPAQGPRAGKDHPLRLPGRPGKPEGGQGRRSLPLGGGQVRPDERRALRRPAPPVEALHHRAVRCAPGQPRAGHRRRHRRPHPQVLQPGRSEWRSGARRHQRLHAQGRSRPPAGQGRGRQRAVRPGRRRGTALPGQPLRRGYHRLRPAQRDAQGKRPALHAARAQAGRPPAGAGILQAGQPAARPRPTTPTRSASCRWPAS